MLRDEFQGYEQISIHSLHTEGDLPSIRRRRKIQISIHSLHTEGDFLGNPHPKNA